MRTINEGSWVWVRLPGRRKFKAEVRAVRNDGVDVRDPKNGGIRTARFDYVEPANRPRGGHR